MVWCRCPGFINWHSFAFSLLFFHTEKRKERKMPKRRQCELERRNEWIENDWRDRGRVKAGLTNFSSRQRVLYFFLANLTNPVAQKYILFMLPYTHSHTHRLCWAIIFGGRCTLFVVLFAVVKLCMCALDANFFFHCRSRRCRRRCSRRFLADEGLLTWLDIDIYTTVCLLLLLSHITCMRLWRFYKKKKILRSLTQIYRKREFYAMNQFEYKCMATHSYHHGLTFKKALYCKWARACIPPLLSSHRYSLSRCELSLHCKDAIAKCICDRNISHWHFIPFSFALIKSDSHSQGHNRHTVISTFNII